MVRRLPLRITQDIRYQSDWVEGPALFQYEVKTVAKNSHLKQRVALFRQEPRSATRKVAADYDLHKATWANAAKPC
jgi:hypothetical protein